MSHRRFSALLILLIVPLLLHAESAPTPLPRRKDRMPKVSDQIETMAEDEVGAFSGPFRSLEKSDFDQWPDRVYVDADLNNVRITREAGQSWADCQQDSKNCVSLANSQTEITRDTKAKIVEREEIDLATGELETVQYMKVHFRDFHGEGDGWVETSSLRSTSLDAIYKKAPKENIPIPSADVPCPDDTKKQVLPMTSNQKDLQALQNATQLSPQEQLDASVDALKPFLGQCPLSPSTKKKLSRWRGKNIYDVEVLPLLGKSNSTYPFVIRSDSEGSYVRKMNVQDMVTIDTLARTLYSEMNECFSKGIQFPMAAAKVALNRAKLYDATGSPAHFVGKPQDAGKSTLAKALTAPYQFSVWNYKSAENPNDKTTLMSLCPAKDQNSKQNWKGHAATPDDVEAWDLAVKIATDTVLFQNRFESKTSEVTQLYYTSKRDSYDSRQRASPSIQGRKVSSKQCMYLWNGD